MYELRVYLWYTQQSNDPDAFLSMWVPGNVSVDNAIMLTMIAMQRKSVFSATVEILSESGVIVYTRSAIVLWGAEMLNYQTDKHSL